MRKKKNAGAPALRVKKFAEFTVNLQADRRLAHLRPAEIEKLLAGIKALALSYTLTHQQESAGLSDSFKPRLHSVGVHCGWIIEILMAGALPQKGFTGNEYTKAVDKKFRQLSKSQPIKLTKDKRGRITLSEEASWIYPYISILRTLQSWAESAAELPTESKVRVTGGFDTVCFSLFETFQALGLRVTQTSARDDDFKDSLFMKILRGILSIAHEPPKDLSRKFRETKRRSPHLFAMKSAKRP